MPPPPQPAPAIRIYNTLSREKEPFTPLVEGRVGMYLCGPTVYKPPHIGHLVGPVIFDALKRYLRHRGYAVTLVINITDVDDKLIEKSKELGVPVGDLARRFEGEYRQVLGDLGIDMVDQFPRVSDNIPEIIALCQKLLASGHAYADGGNLWMDVTKDPSYGQLSGRKLDQMEAVRETVGAGGKKHPADFALWKAAKAGEPSWKTPWGGSIEGRPGWHIECSAMSMKLLGETFDIHGGGLDLLFPHHENELCQSRCATGKPLSKYWVHNGLTRVKTKLSSGEWASEKMSGSIGNVIDARALLNQYGPEVLRYFLLSTHYRSPIEFTDQALSDAVKGYSVFTRLAERVGIPQGVLSGEALEAISTGTEGQAAVASAVAEFQAQAEQAMADDFNTAGVISALHGWASHLNGLAGIAEKSAGQGQATAVAAIRRGLGELVWTGRELIGLFRTASAPPSAGAPDDGLVDGLMQVLISLRAEARASKNYAIADAVRKGLEGLGLVLEDKGSGTIWRRKS